MTKTNKNTTPNDVSLHMARSRARIALLDADSILYAAAIRSEVCHKADPENGRPEDEWFETRSLEDTYEDVCSRMEDLVNTVRADDALICLTPTARSFRYSILPTYKAQRKAFRRPGQLLDLQRRVFERKPFNTIAVRGLEADDVCGISSGTLQAAKLKEPIVVSIDKDLRQIPGLLYSWINPDDGIQEITARMGDDYHVYQTLCGDVPDNYAGCPKVGPKKAGRLIEAMRKCTLSEVRKAVFALFRAHGSTEDNALTQARVARILRSTDWNQQKYEVTLWAPPGPGSSLPAPPQQTRKLLLRNLPGPADTIH